MTSSLLDNRHQHRLRRLSTLHFVLAGLALPGLAFIAFDGWCMHAAPTRPEHFRLIVCFYALCTVAFVIGGVLNLLAGRYLRTRRHRRFCMLVAGLDCLLVPFGTIVGIVTLVTLEREEARIAFAAHDRTLPPAMP